MSQRTGIHFAVVVLLLPLPAAAAADPAPGQSAHGAAFNDGPRQAAVLLNGTGVVRFPVVTNSPGAQAFVTQGVGMLHGFWYVEAERSFRQAAVLDPSCAMAYWGMAFANFDNEPRARTFIAEAVKRRDRATPRERLYIEALDGYLNAINRDIATRRRELVKKYESIVHRHPADLEAKALLVWQMWDNHQHGVPLESRFAADALVGEVLAAEPRHPAHHYRIHVTDHPDGDRGRALASAAACGPVAPAVPHMWHMPGHTYADVKRFADAAWQMEAALRVEHAYLMRMRLVPDESRLYVHNRNWLIDNLDYAGRVRDAVDLCKHVIELPRQPGGRAAADARRKLLDILSRHERWDELRALENSEIMEPTDDRGEQARRLVAFGRAALARGDQAGAIERLARLNDLAADAGRGLADAWAATYGPTHLAAAISETVAAGASTTAVGFATDVLAVERLSRRSTPDVTEDGLRGKVDALRTAERACAELRGHVALANGGARAALDSFAKADVAPEVLAQVHLMAGEPAKAEAAISDAAGRVYRLANRVDLLQRLGKSAEAQTVFVELRALAGPADLDDPPLARLASLAASYGWPADWRTPVVPSDVGPRPPRDTLGPFRWQPWPAADWALPDAAGRTVRLADHRGRPVVVIFYLGMGCVHCVEQLGKFAPKAKEFADAGIGIVAIGTDTVEALKSSTARGKLPFTVLADPGLATFRAYQAFDDFERVPLHATVLIDGAGRVRWQAIGAEPFGEVEFLLGEAKRLLGRQ